MLEQIGPRRMKMSYDYPKMLEAARQYRDKRLCPDCQELQREVQRLRELIAATDASATNDEVETLPPAQQAVGQ